jgi:geranylgeranyl diphosphate synthase, type II
LKFELETFLRETREKVDQALRDYLQHLCPSERMRQPIAYALMGAGKRVRPILCLAANAAVSEDSAVALPAACALEMIHTYSLIHDDLPALDNDQMRRGRPTCHIQFSESTAILTGDALLNMAFELLAESAMNVKAVSGMAAWVKVMACIAHASGCRGMIEGQARDLAFEGASISIEALQKMHALKTGALIQAAISSGAILGQASTEQLQCLEKYGECIGLAFQVVDDILNIKGDPSVMGKAAGTDAARAKNTYPALLGLAESEQLARTLIDRALQALHIFDNKADPLRSIARYIIERNR